MIHVLKTVESILPVLLDETEAWQGLYADSEKPNLKRLWRQWYQYRINLHHFTSCTQEEEFPHPHPWRMAVRILEGSYVMGLGYRTKYPTSPDLIYREYKPGDSYEMTRANEWHAIRPLGDEALTIMVSGPVVFEQNKIFANKPSRPLTQVERSELFGRIRSHYPVL
jgi:hypothetical protein